MPVAARRHQPAGMAAIFMSQQRIRHRIKPALGKRPAPSQPFHRQPASAPRSMPSDRFLRILRTRRVKLAGPTQERRKKNPVKLHQRQQQPLPRGGNFPRRCFRGTHLYSVGLPGATGAGAKTAVLEGAPGKFSSFSISCSSAANSAVATVVFGCTTMSHPAAISRRCNLNISRSRRRIRLRFTAFPSAFLMLHPNRLTSSPLGRTNSVNSRLLRRRPSRYTASYSARRISRVSRGRSSRGGSDAREGVAPFLAACGKDFPSALGLHAFAESVFLVAAPHVRLISAFRQRKSPLIFSARPPTRLSAPVGLTPASNLSRPVRSSHNTTQQAPARNKQSRRPMPPRSRNRAAHGRVNRWRALGEREKEVRLVSF